MPTPRRKAGSRRTVFSVGNIDKVVGAFKDLPGEIQKKVLRAAVRKAMKPVETAVLEEAPIGQTSQLISGVRLTAGRKRRKRGVALYVQIGEGDFLGETFYAAMVEFGHMIRKTPRGAPVAYISADPFMERAFDRTAAKARDDAMDEIRTGSEKVIAKLGRKGRLVGGVD